MLRSWLDQNGPRELSSPIGAFPQSRIDADGRGGKEATVAAAASQ